MRLLPGNCSREGKDDLAEYCPPRLGLGNSGDFLAEVVRVTKDGEIGVRWLELDLHVFLVLSGLNINQPAAMLVANGAQRPGRQRMGTMIDFARPDGGGTKGYLAAAGADRPSLVVIQEWWGLNDQICGVADRFARAGYNALAPDLYEGRVTQEPDEANHLMSGLDFPGATHQDLRGAALHLQGIGGAVGVMGFCMGGALTIASAVHVPEVKLGVCFYGIPPREFADPAKITIPLQCHFANQDDWCTPQAVNELEAALTAAGANAEIHRYDAAHGFFNETSEAAYQAAAANLAWRRMSDYLAANL